MSESLLSMQGEYVLQCIEWQSWLPKDGLQSLKCMQFDPLDFKPDACLQKSGPYTHLANCPNWEVAVFANAKRGSSVRSAAGR